MAFIWTKIAEAAGAVAQGVLTVGTVFRYAGNEYIVVNTYPDGLSSDTASLNYLLQHGFITHADGTNTPIADPNAALYIRSSITGNTTYEQLATAEHGFQAVAGTSYFYGDPAGSDYGIVTAVQTAQAAAFYNDLFQDPGYFTVVRAYTGNPVINQPVYQMIDVTPPAVTLSDKVTAGFTKTVEKLNENRTHIKAAEADIAGLKTRVTAVEGVAASKAAIDDAALASTTTVLSAAKTMQEISDAETRAKNSAVETIMGGATSAQLDTIKELGEALTAVSGDGLAAINSALAKRVSVESQTLTTAEKAQVHTNLGIKSAADTTAEITAAVAAATISMNDLLGNVAAVDIDAMFAAVQSY